MDQPGRLHAFDNLRAIMMWLGVVLHVAVNHTTGTSPLPFRDWQTTPLADLALMFIYAFRMPVFFILSGFFVAFLIARRGTWGMLRHRMRRLRLPFAIFWPIMLAGTVVLMLVYLHIMHRGTAGIDRLLTGGGAGASPFNTIHLWFLYYLIWFCALTAALAPSWARAPAGLQALVDRIFLALAGRWWGVFVLTLPLAFIGASYHIGVLTSNGSFMPQATELVHHGLFFVFGLLAHRHQDALFPRLVANCRHYAVAGAIVFIGVVGLFIAFVTWPGAAPRIRLWIAFFYNLASWLWSLALVGLFLRHVSKPNRVLRYVSESSYWVFLVHTLGTIGFGAMVYSLPLGAVAKMALNVGATTAACLLTYHLFVRNTAIGVLLNGRRQRPRGVSEPAGAGA